MPTGPSGPLSSSEPSPGKRGAPTFAVGSEPQRGSVGPSTALSVARSPPLAPQLEPIIHPDST
eukprot:12253857-Alexandrium_andersonii.AAC.1